MPSKKPPSGQSSRSSSALSVPSSWRVLASPRSSSTNSMRSSPGLSRTLSNSSSSSLVSLRPPSYSPFTDISSVASSPRRYTPGGRHMQPKYDPKAPVFRPVSCITPVTSGGNTPRSKAPRSVDSLSLHGFTTTPEISVDGRNSALSGRVSALSGTLAADDSVSSAGVLSVIDDFIASRTRSCEGALSRTSSVESSVSALSRTHSRTISRTSSASSRSSVGTREMRELMLSPS